MVILNFEITFFLYSSGNDWSVSLQPSDNSVLCIQERHKRRAPWNTCRLAFFLYLFSLLDSIVDRGKVDWGDTILLLYFEALEVTCSNLKVVEFYIVLLIPV